MLMPSSVMLMELRGRPLTEEVPPVSEGMVKPPSLPDTVVASAPVPVFLTLTSAPGMTAPDESTTTPDNEVKKLPCAEAPALVKATRRSAARMDQASLTLINNPPCIAKVKRLRE